MKQVQENATRGPGLKSTDDMIATSMGIAEEHIEAIFNEYK